MKYFIPIIISIILFFVTSCQQGIKDTPAPFIEMEAFFKNGDKTTFKISPDGKHYSYRADYKGKMNIFIQNIETQTTVRVTNDTLRSILFYGWKGNRIIYIQDNNGDENYHLFSVNPDGSDLKDLTPFPGVRAEEIDQLRDLPGRESEMVVGLNKRTPEYFDPYLINVETGDLKLLYENKGNFNQWLVDHNAVVRMALLTDGVNNTWHYRDSELDSFQPLMTTNFKETFTPWSFDQNNKTIFALSNLRRDKIALIAYDPKAKKEIKELFSDSDYDLAYAEYDRLKHQLKSVEWDAEKPAKYIFEPEWKNVHDKLYKQLNTDQLQIVSYDDARTKAIIRTESDRNPGVFYLFDFKTNQLDEISRPYHWLKEEQMSKMQPINYTSRDGLKINGYLTTPIGIEPKNLPVIINPHGGPWFRDTWFFNPEVQFLANRGYAVLQINFRGSTGYGRKFWEAGFKEWGKKMQDDITDGVNWLIEEGIADKERIAIYGASYGGYATLAGITFTPDLYAAAVDYVGVSNLFTFYKTVPAYWKPFMESMNEMVGNPVKDSLLLAAASPALHADKIKTPLFIAQGANDPRVNKAESDQMVAALKKRGIEVEYMVKYDEGHGFTNQENQYEFYGAMEKFLKKYLKNR